MARSTGCGERAATAAAVASTVLASTPSMGRTSTTLRSPCVSVPVLSTATAAMAASRSRCRPPLISTPRRAAAASADTIEIGVLSTSAHGQAMTSSTSARYTAGPAASPNASGGTRATSAASTRTAGV